MLSITPATKVAELLEHYPELETVLIGLAPPFEKLRNPILRRTVARVASLEQASAIAGLSVRELVVALRRAAGQPVEPAGAGGREVGPAGAAHTCAMASSQPCAPGGVGTSLSPAGAGGVTTIDADALLAAGEVPLKPIFDAAAGLAPGERLQVLVSFRPVPLMERLAERGYQCEVASSGGRLLLVVTPPAGQARS
jgi:hypothetical protein